MNKFTIYSLGLTLLNGVTAQQIYEILQSNKKFNKVSIVEQKGGLSIMIENPGRSIDILKLVDEVKQAVEAVYGRCFIYDPNIKEIQF